MTADLPDHVLRNRSAWDRWAPDLCMPDDENEPATPTMIRPYRGMHRFEWESDESVNFHLGYGDWIRLLRANGFDVENLVELWPAEGATASYPFVTAECALKWPSEEVWVARKDG